MAMSFQSSEVGLNAKIFRQFRTAEAGLETALRWSYVCDCVSWAVQNELLKFFISMGELILKTFCLKTVFSHLWLRHA